MGYAPAGCDRAAEISTAREPRASGQLRDLAIRNEADAELGSLDGLVADGDPASPGTPSSMVAACCRAGGGICCRSR